MPSDDETIDQRAPAGGALPPLGAHVSVAGGLPTAIPRAEELGCTAIQIFVRNPNSWRSPPISEDDAESFAALREESIVGPVVAHASYLINLAATDAGVLARSRVALADELARCARAGVDALVLHPGAHLGTGEEAGVARAAEVLGEVLAEATPGPRLLLENTAGQGTVLGWRLAQLAAIRAALGETERARVGVCLDTCHAFAAGYAIHEPAGYDDFWAEVEEVLGLDAVGCLHLNDSLRPFASRKDRHAHVGEGEMGVAPFARLLHDGRLTRVPMVLETETGDGMAGHRRDLELLRSLAPEDGGRL